MAVNRASLDYRKLQRWWKSCAQGSCKQLRGSIGVRVLLQVGAAGWGKARGLCLTSPAPDNVLEWGQPPGSQKAWEGLREPVMSLGTSGCAVGTLPAGSRGTSRPGGVHGLEHGEDSGGDS